jgi:hypothetical protein
MAASTTSAAPVAGVCVGITLTPADVKVVECALRSELAAECAEILAGPLPGRDEIERISTIVDAYAQQFEMLQWGDPRADIEMDCPTSQLDTVALDLLDGGEIGGEDHRVAVCAMLEHLLNELHGRPES